MPDLLDLEALARAQLDPGVFDYIAGGAFDEVTLRDNRDAWDRIRLRPRVLVDVATVATATSFLGTSVAAPIAIAATAFHRLAHPDGELATAQGARQTGALYTVSTRSTTPIEEIAAALDGSPFWYQVYLTRDRGLTLGLAERAVDAGARALVLTGDTPVLGRRLRDIASGFVLPSNIGSPESLDRPGNLADQDPSVTYADIGMLAQRFSVPVLVKGVLRGDDAERCLAAGAVGVVVSNHGGRQLDGAIATAEALPEVVDAVAGGGEVFVDGGVRRGADVLKALALGARGVLIGRPVLWGLALDGESGVAQVLTSLRDELVLAMQLAGASELSEVTPDLVRISAVGGR